MYASEKLLAAMRKYFCYGTPVVYQTTHLCKQIYQYLRTAAKTAEWVCAVYVADAWLSWLKYHLKVKNRLCALPGPIPMAFWPSGALEHWVQPAQPIATPLSRPKVYLCKPYTCRQCTWPGMYMTISWPENMIPASNVISIETESKSPSRVNINWGNSGKRGGHRGVIIRIIDLMDPEATEYWTFMGSLPGIRTILITCDTPIIHHSL